VETDHKPLLAIHKKSVSAAPKRLRRMWLRLQRYDFDLIFRPSSEMILADTQSRAFHFQRVANDGADFHEELQPLSTVDGDQMSKLKISGVARVWCKAAGGHRHTTKGKKVKASHTRHRALGPELIPVYRQSACR